MSRYIKDTDVYRLVEPRGTARVHCSQIDDLPRADVVEVRHGEWKEVRERCFNLDFLVLMGYKCSVCGAFVETGLYRDKAFNKKFCGNCGAKMDGRREENEG